MHEPVHATAEAASETQALRIVQAALRALLRAQHEEEIAALLIDTVRRLGGDATSASRRRTCVLRTACRPTRRSTR